MVSFPSGFHPLEQEINRQVLALAQGNQVKLYLVGGYLRDALIGRFGSMNLPKDFDYACPGRQAVTFARLVAQGLSGHFVMLDEGFDTARVVLDSGLILDFAGCVGDQIESDLRRRDFTINALAWDPDVPDQIIDLVGGLEDLQGPLIRAIAETNFVEDPLRLLRAFRFVATLGGTIDPLTKEMIWRQGAKLACVAPERISYELFEIAKTTSAAPVIKLMWESGLLEVIFPELTAMRQVTPNAFHHLSLHEHSLEVVAQAEGRAGRLSKNAQASFAQEVSSGISRLAATKIACLLHDIGKPATWEITSEGRHTFYGHDRTGAEMSELIAQRLRWPRPLERFVVKLVRWHLRPGQLFHQGRPTDRAVHRFYRTVANDVPELILLAFSDLAATCGPGLPPAQRQELEKDLNELLDGFFVFQESEQSKVRLLDGKQVMKLLNIDEGPLVGEILTALDEAQALLEVRNRAEAETFVANCYQQKMHALYLEN